MCRRGCMPWAAAKQGRAFSSALRRPPLHYYPLPGASGRSPQSLTPALDVFIAAAVSGYEDGHAEASTPPRDASQTSAPHGDSWSDATSPAAVQPVAEELPTAEAAGLTPNGGTVRHHATRADAGQKGAWSSGVMGDEETLEATQEGATHVGRQHAQQADVAPRSNPLNTSCNPEATRLSDITPLVDPRNASGTLEVTPPAATPPSGGRAAAAATRAAAPNRRCSDEGGADDRPLTHAPRTNAFSGGMAARPAAPPMPAHAAWDASTAPGAAQAPRRPLHNVFAHFERARFHRSHHWFVTTFRWRCEATNSESQWHMRHERLAAIPTSSNRSRTVLASPSTPYACTRTTSQGFKCSIVQMLCYSARWCLQRRRQLEMAGAKAVRQLQPPQRCCSTTAHQTVQLECPLQKARSGFRTRCHRPDETDSGKVSSAGMGQATAWSGATLPRQKPCLANRAARFKGEV
jgi:hypothetical protein